MERSTTFRGGQGRPPNARLFFAFGLASDHQSGRNSKLRLVWFLSRTAFVVLKEKGSRTVSGLPYPPRQLIRGKKRTKREVSHQT